MATRAFLIPLALLACERAPHPTPALPAADAAAPTPRAALLGAATQPPGPLVVDVTLEGEAECIRFTAAGRLVVGLQRVGNRIGERELDAVTGTALGPLVKDGTRCDMSLSPDGKRRTETDASPEEVASATVRDAKTGKRLAAFKPWPKNTLPEDSGFRLLTRFFPDGDRIAVLLANDTPREASLGIWSAKQRKMLAELPMEAQPSKDEFGFAATPGEALDVSRDGRLVAAGNLDGAVHLFEVAGGSKPAILKTDLDVVNAIAFAPDGRWLAAAGQGGSLTVFELPSGRVRAKQPAPPECGALAVSPDGARIALGCKSDQLSKTDLPVYPAPRALRLWRVAPLLAP